MPYGQPFYTYAQSPYNGQNAGYFAPQQQYGNIYGQQQNVTQNANVGFSQQQQQVIPPKSNMIFVTSAEDALNRQAEFNSTMVYFHQDQPFGFQVKTDMQGKKALQPFKTITCTVEEMLAEIQGVTQAQAADFATKADLKALEEKLVAMAQSFMQPQVAATPKPKKTSAKVETDEMDKE